MRWMLLVPLSFFLGMLLQLGNEGRCGVVPFIRFEKFRVDEQVSDAVAFVIARQSFPKVIGLSKIQL